MVFASKKVLTDFVLVSLMIVLVPVILVVSSNYYISNNQNVSELFKVIFSVVPSVLFINIVIGVYIYKAFKDP